MGRMREWIVTTSKGRELLSGEAGITGAPFPLLSIMCQVQGSLIF